MTAYHGGKQRIGKELAQVIYNVSTEIEEKENFEIKGYCEPFCGMLGVYQHIPKLFEEHRPRLRYKAGDANKSVVMMWQEAQGGWVPPSKKISKKEFMRLKYDGKSSADKGFIGHFYGYMGKYFQPFDERATKEKIQKQIKKIADITKKIEDVSFKSGLYTQFSGLKNYIIYCDPPYEKQSNYYTETSEKIEKFDHNKFWDWCLKMSENNIVFVSEYKAPNPFKKIWSKLSRTPGASMVEKLYVL